jgi:hypothetical protein
MLHPPPLQKKNIYENLREFSIGVHDNNYLEFNLYLEISYLELFCDANIYKGFPEVDGVADKTFLIGEKYSHFTSVERCYKLNVLDYFTREVYINVLHIYPLTDYLSTPIM